ncbi:MAG: response regulator transcription factor [Bacteroidia bacterium]|nr:response regulator transcription factor [Bacteroidia bacterium]
MAKIIIIDDEQGAIEAIETILRDFCPTLEIVATSNLPVEAIKLINEKKPDIIFLDINMPQINGFELLSIIQERNFEVIFTTAYQEYAVKAFRANAIDFILKPVSITEVVEACNKAISKLSLENKNLIKYKQLLESIAVQNETKVSFPTFEGIVFLNRSDIIRAEADLSYTTLWLLNQKKLVVSKNISEIEKIINDTNFFRVHKSHLVNLKHVSKYNIKDGGEIILSDNSRVELSRRKKDAFLDAICNNMN